MLPTSPDPSCAASPPGPPSSQSSSVGSCYTSSSSQASLRARPTLSDPSSSATSPASAYDRSSELSYPSSHAKQSLLSSAQHGTESFGAAARPVDYRFNDPFASSRNRTLHASHSPRGNRNPFSTMEPPSSTAYQAADLPIFHHSGPSNGITSDYETQVSKDGASLGSSPDNSRGPAHKARRTSPGGSRASGNLEASNGSAQDAYLGTSRSPKPDLAFASAMQTSSTPALTHRPSLHAAYAEQGSYRDFQQTGKQLAQPSTSMVPPPRTRVDDRNVASTAPQMALGTQDSQLLSSNASSSSLTDRNDAPIRLKPPPLPKMDLATFAPQELLKILATLLHEIATANDEFQPDGSKDESPRSRRAARSRDRSGPATPAESGNSAETLRDYSAPPGSYLSFSDSRRPSVTTAALGALATPSSTLCFHARNVPSISIESYLLRILKYCPTTNEVFLSLLVYFDRMSRMGTGAKPGANGEGEVAGEAAGLPRAVERATGQTDTSHDSPSRPSEAAGTKEEPPYTHPGIRGFAIDSYNVHRLVIAGVTVASKFFSDVFYTNSRYAKVGGLPPHELNQLELQFLLLNDFRLTIPLEEMQRYADQLLMYANGRPDMVKLTKEVAAPQVTEGERPSSSSSALTNTAARSKERIPEAANADHTEAEAPLTTKGTRQRADAGPTYGVVHDHDREGDVHMSDAQR